MPAPADAFRAQHPDRFFLHAAEAEPLTAQLRALAVIAGDETIVRVEAAGAGNMNCTLRVRTSRRSLIVKQARPWVEKYPQFAAPWDRALRELEFYRLVAPHPQLAAALPRLLAGDTSNRLLVLEDLGMLGDFTDVYSGAQLTGLELAKLAEFLSGLHRAFANSPEHSPLTNREMRALNHAHIFMIPFQADNGLDLDSILPGLASVAEPVKRDASLVATIGRLGQDLYLKDGPCLLHGDYFPGSLVRTAGGPRVIDPEFGFFGQPEFDVGVFLAHLLLSRQPADLGSAWLRCYEPPTGFNRSAAFQLAGVEILRRLLGYAQLPLQASLVERAQLIARAVKMVERPALEILFQP